MLAFLALLGSVLWVSLSGALSPGPLTTLTIREAVRRGFWAGPLISLGHAAAELAVVLALAFGLSRVLQHDAVTGAIGLVGGAFILWTGAAILRTLPRQRLELAPGPPPAGGGGPVAVAAAPGAMARSLVPAGVLISVSNPYWLIWWATIGAGFMSRSLEYGAAGVAAVYLAHVSTDFAWLGLIAFALATGRRLVSTRVYRAVLGLCGAFLVALGLFFMASGLGFLLG
ncbi:MAG TPA: LysE family transporter [Dehalococcoidia bacterium]